MTLTSSSRRLSAGVTAAVALALLPAASAATVPQAPAAPHSAAAVLPPATGSSTRPSTAPTHPSAPAPSSSSTASCTAPAVSQPFAGFGDHHNYALVPGEAPDSFSGTGWKLTGHASITTARLYDGSEGSVLDLPAGATAVSPPVCLTNLDPTARAMVQDLAGSAGVDIRVTYLRAHGTNRSTGNLKGRRSGKWALSRTVRIHPSSTSGWQLARFTFIARGGHSAHYRLYDFYVDPRMVH